MRYALLLPFLLLIHSLAGGQVLDSDPPAGDSPAISRPVLKTITITGNKKTRRNIITREMSIREGESFHPDSLAFLVQENRLRLLNLALFAEVSLTVDTLSEKEIAWNIQLKERWYIWPEVSFQLADRNFNVWWKEQERDIRRTIIGLTLKHRNFRGNNEQISVTAQVGYTQKAYFDYSRPYIDKNQKHGIGFSFGVAESQETFYATDSNKLQFIKTRDEYIIRQYEGTLSYSYRPAFAARHLFRISYRQTHIADTVRSLNPEYFKNGSNDMKMLEFIYRYELNQTDNWAYPLRGNKLIGQLFLRKGLEGLDFQSLATLEAGVFRNPVGKWYVSSIFRGRLAFPEDQPYAFRAALGTKYDYVRGYEYYVIDGSHFGVLRGNIKYELLNHNFRKLPFRYLPMLPLRIYPKLFADAGYVRNLQPGNSFLNNRMLYSWGAGVDIVTAYDIKIRLEYAFNHLGQKGLFLHLNSE